MVRGVALQAVAVAAVALTCATAVRCSVLLDEARGLLTRHCAQKERCSQRHPSKVATAPEDFFHATLPAVPCFCDENCHTFQDCCYDLAANATQPADQETTLGFPSTAWSCQFLIRPQVASDRTTARFAWMVSRCPGEADAGMAAQCVSLAPDRTYIHDLPIIAGGVMFRNIYCAGCYGMTYNDLFPLNLEISCLAKHVTSQDLINATYVPGELRFVLEDSTSCDLEIRQLKSISGFNSILKENNSPPLRLCREGLIGWCPDDWDDEDVRLKCSEYIMIVQEMDGENRLFRNPHCAQCYNVTEIACGMAPINISLFNRVVQKPRAPLSLIFHFSFGSGNVVGHEACSEGYLWDAIFQKCHPVFTCDSGAKFKSGHCPADEEEEERDSDDPLELAKNTTFDCDRVVLRQDEFSKLENGSILLNASMRLVPPSDFSQLEDARVEVCADSVPGLTLDAQGGDTSFSPFEGTLSLICTIVSLVGLALHLIVLVAVPRMRNLPGLISMGISASLMAAQILFLVATSPAVRPAELVGCVALAAVLHFAFLSVFAWTAVMSFDIWRTFSHPTGHIGNRKSHTKKLQFLRYCAFAFSMPLLIVSLAVALDMSGLDWALSPRYGQSSECWFGSRLGLAAFFALPVLLVLLANLSLYALVVLRIREQRKATKYVEERRHTRYTESDCKLHFSIFNVMGGTWMLGLVAGLVDHPLLWIVFIVLNGSQGAIIFALQILKPRVLHMIRNRLAGREDSTTATSGSSGRTSASALLNRNSERSSAAISLAGGSINLKRRVE